jgi:uncharacterized membrane protein SpoIIM required for sporulation
LTDDLAYARTFYPKSQVVRYLNGLAARTHLAIYKNKKEKRNRFVTFWRQELPLVVREMHRPLFYSLLIFSFGFIIGIFSTVMDESFTRDIMGDAYVSMTIENISEGDPTAVYKQSPSFPMFVRIGFNNMMVTFLTFVAGITFSLGTIWKIPSLVNGLFPHGVMIGTFLTMFYTQDVAFDAVRIVYIHGTLEISALIIAGGAGLGLGRAMLFPGTFSRRYAMGRAAKNGIKVMFGISPVVITAAFFESYITRLTGMPVWLNFLIIIASAALILWYFVWYPIQIEKKMTLAPTVRSQHEARPI